MHAKSPCPTKLECELNGCQQHCEKAAPPETEPKLGWLERLAVKLTDGADRITAPRKRAEPEPVPEEILEEIRQVFAIPPELPPLDLTEDLKVPDNIDLTLPSRSPIAAPPPLATSGLVQPARPAAAALPSSPGEISVRPCGSGWMILRDGSPVDVATSAEGAGERIAALLRR